MELFFGLLTRHVSFSSRDMKAKEGFSKSTSIHHKIGVFPHTANGHAQHGTAQPCRRNLCRKVFMQKTLSVVYDCSTVLLRTVVLP